MPPPKRAGGGSGSHLCPAGDSGWILVEDDGDPGKRTLNAFSVLQDEGSQD